MVKLAGEEGTALGAYHRNDGTWHIWRPGGEEWTDVPENVSHWKDMPGEESERQPMPKWEYKVLILVPKERGETLFDNTECHGRQLGNLGSHGWELVSVVGGNTSSVAYLKRPAKPQMPALLIVNGTSGADFTQLTDEIRQVLAEYVEETHEGCGCYACRGL